MHCLASFFWISDYIETSSQSKPFCLLGRRIFYKLQHVLQAEVFSVQWSVQYFSMKYLLILSNMQIVNPHLLKDLTERGLWNEEMKNQLIAHNGSIQVGI